MQQRVALAVRDRQHRQAGLGVVGAAVQRQRPEVRRGPGEDDQHQEPGLGRYLARHRGPAQRRRHRPREPADHDVLRRGRLEQDGVDHRVAEEGGKGQPHRQVVGVDVQQPHAGAAQYGGEHQGLRRGDLAGGRRAPRGAAHQRIDLLLDQAIDGKGRTGQQPDAGGAADQHAPRHHAGRGEEHADDGAEHGQLRHARLGQGGILSGKVPYPAQLAQRMGVCSGNHGRGLVFHVARAAFGTAAGAPAACIVSPASPTL
ncbi:hypothetical protein D3C72_1507340 [compost metagenome]